MGIGVPLWRSLEFHLTFTWHIARRNGYRHTWQPDNHICSNNQQSYTCSWLLHLSAIPEKDRQSGKQKYINNLTPKPRIPKTLQTEAWHALPPNVAWKQSRHLRSKGVVQGGAINRMLMAVGHKTNIYTSPTKETAMRCNHNWWNNIVMACHLSLISLEVYSWKSWKSSESRKECSSFSAQFQVSTSDSNTCDHQSLQLTATFCGWLQQPWRLWAAAA